MTLDAADSRPSVSIATDGGPATTGGALVIIDVIRAFTTACVLFDRGVREILCAANWSRADDFPADATLVGEVEAGRLPAGVLANSPAVVAAHNLPGFRAGLVSLNGTRVLGTAPPGTVVLAAAAANVTATANWILARGSRQVRLVVTDPDGPEDYACARHLAGLLTGEPVNPAVTRNQILSARQAHWNRWGPTVSHERWRAFEIDVSLCAQLDTHPVVMVADRTRSGLAVLRPVRVTQNAG